VILPDVNVLVYAFRREAVDHERYASWLSATLVGSELALVESVLLGMIRIVTSPRIMADPAPTPLALRFVEALLAAPRARQLAPTAATWHRLRTIARNDQRVRGPLVPDAWLAALALSHGCRLATADRGFARFQGLDWFVPVEPAAER
jgi:toxin-antitoxin system PIN domain toxin